jgi:hypothetical protein
MTNIVNAFMNKQNQFTIDEAYTLMDAFVARNSITGIPDEVSNIGIVCGLLKLNDEVEVVVKFLDGLNQFTKEEYLSELSLRSTK